MWKNIVQPEQATYYNTAHVHCMLSTLDYRHTLRICNTYFQRNNVYTKAPQCYFTRSLDFLFIKQCSFRL